MYVICGPPSRIVACALARVANGLEMLPSPVVSLPSVATKIPGETADPTVPEEPLATGVAATLADVTRRTIVVNQFFQQRRAATATAWISWTSECCTVRARVIVAPLTASEETPTKSA